MEALSNLALGLQIAVSVSNLLYCFVGVLLGTLIGVLPGIGSAATIAMLLPMTFSLDPTSALIMLAGIYYGSQYGGSTAAILINMPGEVGSIVTTLDGYQMARRGRAGAALAIAAVGSFVAGCFATLVIAIAASPLAEVALKFGPTEYFSLMVLGLISASVLAHGSVLKAIMMVLMGLLIGTVGTDISTGTLRFAFGVPELGDGVSIIALFMGMFGIAEVISNLEYRGTREVFTKAVTLMPSREEIRRSVKPILRGAGIGSVLGILPGGGAMLAAFASYIVEKKISSRPQEFGKGAVEGVAGPESANNAGAQASFIPMLTLGIPSNVVMALMIGAMMIQGIAPGPRMMIDHAPLFWGIIVSMWIGNIMLVVLNLPLVGVWIRLLQVPYRLLFPSILLFMVIGVYSVNNNAFDLFLMAVFGLFGLACAKLGMEPAPLALGVVLGPLMEENLRRAMLMSRGDPMVFLTRPISAGFVAASAVVLLILVLPALRRKRGEVFTADAESHRESEVLR